MMSQVYFVALAMCLASTLAAPAAQEDEQTDVPAGMSAETQEQQEEYLRRFYGLDPMPDDLDGSALASALTDHKKAFQNAIKRLQHMASLPETGEVDEETRKVMELPRCGVSDVDSGDGSSRKRRFTDQGSRWRRNDLTYKILNFSPDMLQADQESEIARALNVWSEHTPLTFRRVFSGSADIEVSFATFDHGDGNPFDGQGGVLAHAFFPQYGGDAHMDDSERFTAFTFSGTNMFQVMAHEFGHSMGLAHSNVQSALMAPFYRGYVPNFELDQDDIAGIQSKYGRRVTATPAPTAPPAPTTRSTLRTIRSTRPTPTTPRTTTTRSTSPDLCMDGQFDAITQYNGRTYAFRGSQYVRLNDDGIDAGYPRNIASDWSGLPNNLDAALHVDTQYNYYYRNGRWYKYVTVPESTYFFKGSQVWRFGTRGPFTGYPKSVKSEFPGLPNNIDSAFVWSGNQKIYVTKGSQYYRVTLGSGIDGGYPKSLSVWNGLPSKIDAAFQWTNGKTYFFNGPNYYRFNNRQFTVDRGYPRMINVWWLGCPDNIKADMTNEDGPGMSSEDEQPMNNENENMVTGPEAMDQNTMKPGMLDAEHVTLTNMDDIPTDGQSKLASISAVFVVGLVMLVKMAI